jgi:hypothetical protein
VRKRQASPRLDPRPGVHPNPRRLAFERSPFQRDKLGTEPSYLLAGVLLFTVKRVKLRLELGLGVDQPSEFKRRFPIAALGRRAVRTSSWDQYGSEPEEAHDARCQRRELSVRLGQCSRVPPRGLSDLDGDQNRSLGQLARLAADRGSRSELPDFSFESVPSWLPETSDAKLWW